MIRSLSIAALAFLMAMCTGCASIVSGQNQSLSVTTSREGTDVAGAQCSLRNDKGSWYVTTPGSVTVHRSYQDLVVSCATEPTEPDLMQVKSSTKAMAFGNILVGGAIGVGVDVATGAAYDYPTTIAVSLSPSKTTQAPGSTMTIAATATALAPPPSPWIVGSRLVYSERDMVSGASQGEAVFVVTGVSPSRWAFNDGSIVCGVDGSPQKGSMHSAVIFGAGPSEIRRGGTWTGTFRASGFDDVPAQFTVLARQPKVISGKTFNSVRLKVEGYATRTWSVGQSSSISGAPFEGEMLVDADSGMVLEVAVSSRHPGYSVRRELVRLVSS